MYRHILMPIDGSPCSEQALDHGLALARTLGAEVLFLYVVEDPPNIYNTSSSSVYEPNFHENLVAAGETALEGALAKARARGVAAEVLLRETKSADLVDVILEVEADLTVIATHGRRGLNRLALGSVTEKLLRRANRPCLVVRCSPAVAGKQ